MTTRECPKCGIPTAFPNGTLEHFMVAHNMEHADAVARVEEMGEMEQALADAAPSDPRKGAGCSYCKRSDGSHAPQCPRQRGCKMCAKVGGTCSFHANRRKSSARVPVSAKPKPVEVLIAPYAPAIDALRRKREEIDAAIRLLERM